MSKSEAIRVIFEQYGLLASRVVVKHLGERGFVVNRNLNNTLEMIVQGRKSYRERLEQELEEFREIDGIHYPYASLTIFRRIMEIESILFNDPEGLA